MPLRFYDSRQKHLAFVNTCNEKAAIARRAAQELSRVRPTPPALMGTTPGGLEPVCKLWPDENPFQADRLWR